MIELGITTFGETTPLEMTNQPISHDQRIRDMVEEMVLADQVGLDIYAIGEHHRSDFAVSAPEILLAAGAVQTKRIRLSSAVTVLSSIDPVRAYQQYATIDALSNGRAEMMVGRGSFTESFPLFGYDLNDYEQLFDEKLDMLLTIRANEIVKWDGTLTQTIDHKGVYPRAVQKDFPIYVGTGGNVESTLKIAQKGLPIAYAIIGGQPKQFAPLINLYRNVMKDAGHSSHQSKVAMHSWGYIADSAEEAIKDYFHPTKTLMDTIAKDRLHWRPLTWQAYENSVGETGAMFVGDVEMVTKKIIQNIETLGVDRFMLHMPIGSMPHEKTMRSIELFGKEVAPRVRAHFASKIQEIPHR